MSPHVTAAQLESFIAKACGDAAFEAHVSDCPFCAAALSARARAALLAPEPAVRPWIPALLLALGITFAWSLRPPVPPSLPSAERIQTYGFAADAGPADLPTLIAVRDDGGR